MVRDLRLGPEQALKELKELQSWVLSPSRLQLELLAPPAELKDLKSETAKLVEGLKESKKVTGMAPRARPWILERMKNRYPDAAWGYPVYAGLVHPDSVNGNSVINAYGGGD